MQTYSYYCDIIIPADTKFISKGSSVYSQACFVIYRCPGVVVRTTIHLNVCLPETFCSNLSLFGESVSGFSKNVIDSPGFGIYSLSVG